MGNNNNNKIKNIPVCVPYLAGRELEYVTDCIKSNWISSKGKYVEEFEDKFAGFCNTDYAVTTTSGSTALHLALKSLNIGEGDEVIIPALTMVATAFAVVQAGAKPLLVDSLEETGNIDPQKIESKITNNTKAIIPVHLFGHPADMDSILEIARKHKLFVIEDAAEAHGAEYKGNKAGSFGDVGCFSFYANKIITSGEGGMLTTNDKKIYERAKKLQNQGYLDKIRLIHDEIGFNYRMTNIQAAIGLAQLENIEKFIRLRRENARIYCELLKDVDGLKMPIEKKWVKNVYWMFNILVENEYGLDRDELMEALKQKGIETRTNFYPIHRQPAFNNCGWFKNENYPIAEKLSQRGMYLPSSTGLEKEEISYVCKAIKNIQNR